MEQIKYYVLLNDKIRYIDIEKERIAAFVCSVCSKALKTLTKQEF